MWCVRSLPEVEQRVRGPAPAHLVVEAREHDIVAFTEAAVAVDEVLGYDEETEPFGSRSIAVSPGEDEVDDVLGQFVVAAGDPHLRAVHPKDALGPVWIGDGSRGDVTK